MAKKAQNVEEAEQEVTKDERTIQREREDKLVAALADTPENVNHVRRMGRHQDAQRMEARMTVALANE